MPKPKDYNFPNSYFINVRTLTDRDDAGVRVDVYERVESENEGVIHMKQVGFVTLKYDRDGIKLEDFPDILLSDITKKLKGNKKDWPVALPSNKNNL